MATEAARGWALAYPEDEPIIGSLMAVRAMS